VFLAWLTEGARLFARLPYAAVQLPPFPLWLLLAYSPSWAVDGCGMRCLQGLTGSQKL